jgi:hypothetical protein
VQYEIDGKLKRIDVTKLVVENYTINFPEGRLRCFCCFVVRPVQEFHDSIGSPADVRCKYCEYLAYKWCSADWCWNFTGSKGGERGYTPCFVHGDGPSLGVRKLRGRIKEYGAEKVLAPAIYHFNGDTEVSYEEPEAASSDEIEEILRAALVRVKAKARWDWKLNRLVPR